MLRKIKRSRQRGWSGLSVLIFTSDSIAQPIRFRINYFIVIFLIFLTLLLPVISIGLRIAAAFNTAEQRHVTKNRHRLLEMSFNLTLEKKRLIDKAQAELKHFHQQFHSQRHDFLRYLLPISDPILLEDSVIFDDSVVLEAKPGEHRSRYELKLLIPLKRQVEKLAERQIPFILHPIWHRIVIHYIIPKGWVLLGGVGHITSLHGYRQNPMGEGREFHAGIDFAYSAGTPIVAAGPGIVIRAVNDSDSGYGKFVQIHHGFGFTSLYAHCQSLAVKERSIVKKGQVIAYLGQSGRTTGNHLHYEIQLGYALSSDPLPYVRLK